MTADGLVRFEQEMYTGGMAAATDGEWVTFDGAEQWAADAVESFRQAVIEAVEAMPTARIISQWDLISRKAAVAILTTTRCPHPFASRQPDDETTCDLCGQKV